MPKSKAYIGHLMILATTFIYSFNTNFMKVIIPEWIGPNGLVLLRCSASTLVFWLIGLYFPTSSDPPHHLSKSHSEPGWPADYRPQSPPPAEDCP